MSKIKKSNIACIDEVIGKVHEELYNKYVSLDLDSYITLDTRIEKQAATIIVGTIHPCPFEIIPYELGVYMVKGKIETDVYCDILEDGTFIIEILN